MLCWLSNKKPEYAKRNAACHCGLGVLLVLGHRGKLRKLEADFEDRLFVQQLLCLRLAVILCHARRDPDLKGMQLKWEAEPGRRFWLSCRPGWAEAFPQSAYLLQEEVLAWQKTPWTLAVLVL